MFLTAPYQFNESMSNNWFEDILFSHYYTSRQSYEYKYNFMEFCEVLENQDTNMFEMFVLGWITRLDGSIIKRINQFKCRGFIFVPSKPLKFRNEFYTFLGMFMKFQLCLSQSK